MLKHIVSHECELGCQFYWQWSPLQVYLQNKDLTNTSPRNRPQEAEAMIKCVFH